MSDMLAASTCCDGCPGRRCRGCQCALRGLTACEGELRAKLEAWRLQRRAPGSRIAAGSLRYVPTHLEGDRGPRTGHHLEHWSGRVDATIERVQTYVYPQMTTGVTPDE